MPTIYKFYARVSKFQKVWDTVLTPNSSNEIYFLRDKPSILKWKLDISYYEKNKEKQLAGNGEDRYYTIFLVKHKNKKPEKYELNLKVAAQYECEGQLLIGPDLMFFQVKIYTRNIVNRNQIRFKTLKWPL